MDEYHQIVTLIAMSMGIAWASGINLYATILMLGIMGSSGNIVLPPALEVLTDPMVMGAAALMYCVEFFADKIPGVDTGWDALHTFVRVPAGAILAAASVGDVSTAAMVTAGILGGGMSLGSHSLKAGSRVLINTSVEPVSNWLASFTEDIMVIAGLWSALHYPLLFLLLLLLFVMLLIWLLPRLWRVLGHIMRKIQAFFSGAPTPPTLGDITPPSSPSSRSNSLNTDITESLIKLDKPEK